MRPLAPALLAAAVSGCCGDPEPPTRFTQALPGGGEFIVDVEMWDACERGYRSIITYVPADGGEVENVVTTYLHLSAVRTVDAREPLVLEVTRGDAALAVVTPDLLLLRLVQGRYGDETLIVRDGSGNWSDHVFREEAYAGNPAWEGDRRPFDRGSSGFSEVVRIDPQSRELVLQHHAGWAIRELTFLLSADGARVELQSVRRLPRDLGRDDVPAGYSDAEITADALQVFRSTRAEEPDDIRVLESRDCPDGEEQDLARVLFGFPKPEAYSTELWLLRRREGAWILDKVELVDPLGIDVLNLLSAQYPRGTACVQYL